MGLLHFVRFGSFAHVLVNGRDAKGHLVEVCECGHSRIVLGTALVLDGPAHQQARDLGARTTKAKRQNVADLDDWKRSQR